MSTDTRQARTILPRAAANEDATPAPSDSGSPSGLSRGGANTSQRTNIRSACLACRRRRSKCSGGNPCSRCRALETDCVYNESQDGRTRALREKSKEELDVYKRVVSELFRAVREGKEQPWLDMIRNNASFEEIAIAVEDSNIETRSESASESTESNYAMSKDRATEQGPSFSSNYPQYDIDLMQLDRMQTTLYPLSGQSPGTAELPAMSGNIIHNPSLDPSTEVFPYIHPDMLQHDPVEANDPLSDMYLTFRRTAKQLIQQSAQVLSNFLGGQGVQCNGITRPDQRDRPFNLATVASAIVNNIDGPDIMFRLAWLCYVTRFLRWSVNSTDENFELMPEAMRPTIMQLTVSHAAVLDLIPIPEIRDLAIQHHRNFFAALELAGATVHWSDGIDDAIDCDPVSGLMKVSARFENHISNANNFCFGGRILETFPEVEGRLIVAEQDQILSVSAAPSNVSRVPSSAVDP